MAEIVAEMVRAAPRVPQRVPTHKELWEARGTCGEQREVERSLAQVPDERGNQRSSEVILGVIRGAIRDVIRGTKYVVARKGPGSDSSSALSGRNSGPSTSISALSSRRA